MKETGTHTTDRLLLIGVGNPLRGDDALGAALVTAMQARPVPGLLCRHVHQLHLELLEDLHAADVVIVADASLQTAGCTLQELRPLGANGSAMGSSASASASSHREDAETLQALYKQLYQRPVAWWVLAMEAHSFDIGAPLSPAAQAHLQQAEALLRAWIARYRAEGA